MLSKKLNNRGYMIVEIIVASVIAFSVAYYLLNLTYKFKDKNEDVYFSTNILADKINITKNIMDDLKGKNVVITSNDFNSVNLKVDDVNKKILIDKSTKTITYGKINDDGSFDKNDLSYYQKKIDSFLEFGDITINGDSSSSAIYIPISNIYSDNIYDVKIFLYASWSKIITINFNLNGGKSDILNMTYEYGDSNNVKIPPNPTKTGYTFSYWEVSRTIGSSTTYYGCTDSSVVCTKGAGNTTIGWYSKTDIVTYWEPKGGWVMDSLISEYDLDFKAIWD